MTASTESERSIGQGLTPDEKNNFIALLDWWINRSPEESRPDVPQPFSISEEEWQVFTNQLIEAGIIRSSSLLEEDKEEVVKQELKKKEEVLRSTYPTISLLLDQQPIEIEYMDELYTLNFWQSLPDSQTLVVDPLTVCFFIAVKPGYEETYNFQSRKDKIRNLMNSWRKANSNSTEGCKKFSKKIFAPKENLISFLWFCHMELGSTIKNNSVFEMNKQTNEEEFIEQLWKDLSSQNRGISLIFNILDN